MKNRPLWEVVEVKSNDEGAPYWMDVQDPDGWYKASVKWDGCIHYNRIFNEPFTGDEDYLHICDIDHEIVRLQALKKKATEIYGKDWPR